MSDAKLNNDAPITKRKQDRLGFRKLARHLADAFLRNDLSGGLVVGIEGEWGSGKSSLANLAFRRLKKKSKNHRLRIVRFSPWIIGNREELLGQLFAELDSALSDLLSIKRRKHVRTALRKYAQASSFLAAPLKIVGDSGIPAAGTAGRVLDSTAGAISGLATPSLRKINEELRVDLVGLDGKVVVFIDDIDRLEPEEAVEVLRLIRVVADFPNVGYLLAYDPDNLAKCLRKAIGVKNGKAYIDKIVQASFAIPEPMGFDLRSLLAEETRAIFDRVDLTSEASDRLERALSCWCSEYVSTPRDVVRTVNALKLHIAPLADRLDPADGLFIQMIRIHHPELHGWVQHYLMKNFGSDPNDYHLAWKDAVEDSDAVEESKLDEIIGKQDNARLQFLHDLRQHLPRASVPDSRPPKHYDADAWRQFSIECRLYSRSYFRLYFALSLPADFLSDEEVSGFLETCSRDREEAVHQFRNRCAETRSQDSNMAQVLLFRIIELGPSMSPSQILDLFSVLGEGADEFIRNSQSLSGSTVRLRNVLIEVFHLVKWLPMNERMAILEKLFENALSLAWLNGIVWEAAGEHGLTHDISKPVEKRLLTPKEFGGIRAQFLERLKRTDPIQLMETPLFPGLMEVWCLAGGEEDAKAWVTRQASGDEGLVDLLDRLSFGHYVQMPDDYRHAPRRGMLEILFGSVERVEGRLNAIASKAGVTTDLRENAKRLVSAIVANQQNDEEAG